MSYEITTCSPLPLPAPRVPISIRPGTPADIPFIDSLQKSHTKQVGWMPMQQLEQKIGSGHVVVAEQLLVVSCQLPDKQLSVTSCQLSVEQAIGSGQASAADRALTTNNSRLTTPLGYVIAQDQYFKRDDCGIIYQLAVAPGNRRSLVGAALLQAQFDRSAYGCRLYCCWCAQDIEANRFWEAMGFVPIAFRTGADKRKTGSTRVHIFWQKRIRAGDVGAGATPWWFPSKTTGGSIREDRIVLPIPPGMRWWDEMPRLLPAEAELPVASGQSRGIGMLAPAALPEKKVPVRKEKKPRAVGAAGRSREGAVFGNRARYALSGFSLVTKQITKESKKPPAERRRKVKADPKLVAAARELRDRWMERVDREPELLMSQGKYEVSRRMGERSDTAGPGASERVMLAA